MPSVGPFAAASVMADLVQLAEGLGYADVWYGDHVAVPSYATHLVSGDWVEPLTACFVALGRTATLKVGTDVLVLPYRNPLLVAKMAATAHHMSDGRLILGGGVGYLRGEFAALGAPYDGRGRASDEALEIFGALWSSDGDAVDHHGEFWSFDDVRFGPAPVGGRVPVWVGGNAPAALRRAARYGDGWHPLFPTPEQYAASRSRIVDDRARQGRAGGFTFSLSCAATEIVTSARDEYQTHVWTDVPDDFNYAPPAPETADGRPRFVGSPDDVAADVAAYADAGVDHITLRFANGGPDVDVTQLIAQMELFAAEVVPRFG
jgi:probable F420-dependent oxidoreductase